MLIKTSKTIGCTVFAEALPWACLGSALRADLMIIDVFMRRLPGANCL
jgi:hypothetical protein